MNNQRPAWLRPKQAAEYSGVSQKTIAGWMRSGLKHSRLGRVILIHQSDLDQFIQRHGSQVDPDRLAAEILSGLL